MIRNSPDVEYSVDDWLRLGRAVHAERLRRGYADTVKWAAEVGRSTRVVLGLERGEPAGRNTLTRIENALGWAPGRAWSILSGEPTVTEENSGPQVDVDRSSVGADPDDATFVADRGPDDPPAGISDDELLAVLRRQRQELDELERRIRGRSVDGA